MIAPFRSSTGNRLKLSFTFGSRESGALMFPPTIGTYKKNAAYKMQLEEFKCSKRPWMADVSRMKNSP